MFYFGRQVKDTLCSRKHTRSVEGQVSHIDDVYLILYNMYIKEWLGNVVNQKFGCWLEQTLCNTEWT